MVNTRLFQPQSTCKRVNEINFQPQSTICNDVSEVAHFLYRTYATSDTSLQWDILGTNT